MATRAFTGNPSQIIVEQLAASGVKYLFYNSGSREARFFDALHSHSGIHGILALHEGTVAAMAGGYAQVRGERDGCDCGKSHVRYPLNERDVRKDGELHAVLLSASKTSAVGRGSVVSPGEQLCQALCKCESSRAKTFWTPPARG